MREDLAGIRVADGFLELDTTPSGMGGAKNIVLQDQPEGDSWTIETKVDASDFAHTFHQGGLTVYADDRNYIKFDVLAVNQPGNAPNRLVEMRSQVNGQTVTPHSDQTRAIPADGQVRLRLTRDGDTFVGQYSADGETWNDLTEPTTNPNLDDARVGLFTFGESAQGQSYATARFDWFRVISAEEPVEEIAVTTTVQTRCTAGKVYVAVRATNDEDAPVTITLDTPFGSKTFADVAPGANAYQSFASRATSVEAGTVTVTASDAEGRTAAQSVEYEASSCS